MTPSMFANVVFVVVAVILASVNAQNVTCYNCNSVSNSWCGDSLNTVSAIAAGATCQGTYCSKVAGSVSGFGSSVTRSCGILGTGSNSCSGGSLSGIASSSVCSCSTNYCNAATAAVSSIVTTIAAAAGVVLYVAARRLN